jgi:fructose-1,6-bisphosphatase/inositol monophosphatase family enzyme
MTSEIPIKREFPPTKEDIAEVVIDGLLKTYKLHEDLGEDGKADLTQNQFGDMALEMDVKAEEALLDSLKRLNIPLQVFSEEHGKFTQGNYPAHSVILDGLDGSAEYKEKRGESMYGAMISVLEGADPRYNDYLVCGIMIHSPKPQLFIAVKEEGCFKVDMETKQRKLLKIKEAEELTGKSIIDLDTNWSVLRDVYENPETQHSFPRMQCAYFSQAARTALFLNGDIDIQLEVTRKGGLALMGNLEMPSTFGLVKELGGVMVAADGESLGNQKFTQFAQDGSNLPIVVASSRSLALGVINNLSLGIA